MRAMPRVTGWLLVGVLGMAVPVLAAETRTRLLRFPDVHGDHVAFSYAGDLWLAPVTGGTATRLTAHPGVEPVVRSARGRRR